MSEYYLLKIRMLILTGQERQAYSPLSSPIFPSQNVTGLWGYQGWKGSVVRAVRIPVPAKSAADNDPEQSAHSRGCIQSRCTQDLGLKEQKTSDV